MDNITHSLIGITVGQWANRSAPPVEDSKSRNRLWIWTSIAANNFPDLDIVYTSLTPGVLGRLLHHRGHTHTFIAIIPQLILVLAIFWILRRPLGFDRLSKRDWKTAGFITAAGLFLHILADSMNSYGVHPFFPLWNGWIYGDAVFIIEPLLWAILAPGIFFSGRSFLKYVPGVMLAGISAYGWSEGIIGWPGVLGIAVFSGAMVLEMRREKSNPARTAAVAAAVFALLNFAVSRNLRKSFLHSADGEVLDVVLSPVPASPMCWFGIQLTVRGEDYKVKRGVISAVSALVSPENCPDLGRIGNEPGEFQASGLSKAYWAETYSIPLKNFEILNTNCHLKEWMRFSRVPFIEGDSVTDLRFSRRGMKNFTDFEGGESCPRFIPPWIPPRMDLLRLTGQAELF